MLLLIQMRIFTSEIAEFMPSFLVPGQVFAAAVDHVCIAVLGFTLLIVLTHAADIIYIKGTKIQKRDSTTTW